MTTANEEFSDLMPHRIRVTGEGTGYDDYGQPITTAEPRVYMCLIDDSTTEVRTADGTTVTVALTAYTAPVPLGSADGKPVNITTEESIEILNPMLEFVDDLDSVAEDEWEKKTINSIERHWDADDGRGMLHNMVLRFS